MMTKSHNLLDLNDPHFSKINATLSISSNDPDTSILKVSLTGNGIAPNISINFKSRDFGNVNMGSNSNGYGFKITNTGNGSLSIGKISSSNSEFSIYSDSCSNKTWAPSKACMVYVRFSPRMAGTRTPTLTIPSNDPDTSALRVSLSGNGVASPNIVFSHRSFNFGNMNVGNMSGSRYFRIYNRGTGNLRIERVSLSSSEFVWADYCSNRQIAPNSSCYVRVAFRPRTTGSKSAILSISSNVPDTSTLKITLSGNGVGLPNMVINPTSYYFGNVNVGRSSSIRGVTGDILKAGGELKIFSDNILLDEGVKLEDVIEATDITVEPAKILYEVSVSGSGTVNGKPGETLTLKVTVANSGPEVDTYTLKMADAEGWNLGTLPETVTVEGLDSTDLELIVTLPSEYGVSDVITVTATSQADSTVEASTEIEVLVPYMVSGTVHNQNGGPIAGAVVEILGKTIEEESIEIEGISTFTDENGLFEIVGLLADNYTLKGSYKDVEGTPQDLTIEDQNVVINMVLNTSEDGTEVTEDSKLEGVEDENTGDDSDDSEDTGGGNVDEDEDESTEIDTIDGYMVSGKILDNVGKSIAAVTVKVGEQTTESNADGYWHIGELKAGDYTATTPSNSAIVIG